MLLNGDQIGSVVRGPGRDNVASLRAKATDSKGNSTELTVIRAYKITK